MPQPDLSLLPPERWNDDSPGEFEGAPEIAIEVVSSETAARLQEKIDIYLENGTRQVWVLYPAERIILVHKADGSIQKLKHDQVLEAPDLLPLFRAPIAEFFEGI